MSFLSEILSTLKEIRDLNREMLQILSIRQSKDEELDAFHKSIIADMFGTHEIN